MEALQVTNYDVLADKMPGNSYVLSDYRRHIGNTRFAVLVDMYREGFDMLLMRGNEEECEKIVDRIVGVACHKDVAITVNKGRFLVRKNGEGPWIRLEDEECKEVARQALMAPAPITEEETAGEVVASTFLSAMTLGSKGVVPLPPPALPDTSDFNNDKKRGRRRSLLRRSASESTMMDDKKKLQIRGLGLDTTACIVVDEDDEAEEDHVAETKFEPRHLRHAVPKNILSRQRSEPVISSPSGSHRDSGQRTHGAAQNSVPKHPVDPPLISHFSEQIKQAEGMDVVLSTSGRTLTSKETFIGNNRLRVMIQLQQGSYKTGSSEDKEKIAEDLVKTVCTHWGGRILVDTGFAYAKLADEQATLSMKNLLDPDTAKTIIVSTSASEKPLLASAPQVPDYLRAASLEILTSNGVPTVDPEVMQNQAIKSLQERQAKRLVAKNLGKIHLKDHQAVEYG